jgi:hypothetical protein
VRSLLSLLMAHLRAGAIALKPMHGSSRRVARDAGARAFDADGIKDEDSGGGRSLAQGAVSRDWYRTICLIFQSTLIIRRNRIFLLAI